MTTTNKTRVRSYADHKAPAPASPSASIILISPSNKVLLLHRRHTSSAFPSAHVFPGGNLEPSDGEPNPKNYPPNDPARHIDNLAYRTCAMRELFEESGILLAKDPTKSATNLLSIPPSTRLAGRKTVHSSQTNFLSWLATISPTATLDTDNLVPFTHWITPPNVPKRFTTQMYLYFVHLREEGDPSVDATSDEVETMTAEWRTATEWLERCVKGEVILFPPQFLLLSFVARFLDRSGGRRYDGSEAATSASASATGESGSGTSGGGSEGAESLGKDEIVRRRRELYDFITKDGDPPWSQKYISPIGLAMEREDGRQVLGLNKPGPELKDSDLRGDDSRVVLVKFSKEGPRQVEVRMRNEVMGENRRERQNDDGKSKL